MSAQIIDGKVLSSQLERSVQQKIEARSQLGLRIPALVVIQVGDNSASNLYVQRKQQACVRVGIHSTQRHLPASISQEQLSKIVEEYNQDPLINGILIQLPLPQHIESDELLDKINPLKDVDGFHPFNMGRLAQRRPLLRPCTPFGIMKLFESIHFDFKHANVVVVGASNIVGRPMGLELLAAGATVTFCHRFTPNLKEHLQQADAVVVAIGKPHFIQGKWLKPGCVVMDVGISRLPDGKIAGDVAPDAFEVAGWITPVPGGVGPMTVAMLLENTLQAATLQEARS